MKKSILLQLSLLVLLAFSGFAQDGLLPVDNTGKITFYEVVEVPGLSQAHLRQNAMDFLANVKVVKQKKKESFLLEEDSKITTTGSFLVYKFKSPDGEIRYNLSIEVKDNKYRYTITDFVFFPYTRNRYGRYEREKWKSRPMEQPVPKGQQKTWSKHESKTLDKMNSLIGAIEVGMQQLPAVAEDPKDPSETNW